MALVVVVAEIFFHVGLAVVVGVAERKKTFGPRAAHFHIDVAVSVDGNVPGPAGGVGHDDCLELIGKDKSAVIGVAIWKSTMFTGRKSCQCE